MSLPTTQNMSESPSSTARTWTIFCAVIDNHGDMGVCWRLARQLVNEHGIEVVLWIDDLPAFADFLGLDCVDECVAGVQVRHWTSPWPSSVATDALIAESAVVIEAFACELPESVIDAFAQRDTPPLWINLEYLSAESWVTQCHGLHSLHSVSRGVEQSPRTLSKTFFFPGFVPGTGGLLREGGLLERHEHWQTDEQSSRQQLLVDLGLALTPEAASATLWISVFTYESASLASWFDAMAESDEPVLCLVPEGRVLSSVAEYLDRHTSLVPGESVRVGALSIVVIPFLSQDDYDRLLSLCDLNLVRGEDSFVRAQWAARPLVWHIYPQEEGVHMEKLGAFLGLYCGQTVSAVGGQSRARPAPTGRAALPEMEALRRFWEFWNLGEDCRELWHHLRPQLPGLRERARNWQLELAQLPDLAANLVNYHRQQQC